MYKEIVREEMRGDFHKELTSLRFRKGKRIFEIGKGKERERERENDL